MNTKDLLRFNIDLSQSITKAYVSDVTQEEMLVRAVPGSNHIAWQLGHLIASERSLLEAIGADVPDLPAGFAEAHGKENIDSDDASQFHSKETYFELMEQMHKAAQAAIDKTDEAAMDAPAPESMRSFFPTVGSILLMTGTHEMMHAGQIAAIRRKLGKPVVI